MRLHTSAHTHPYITYSSSLVPSPIVSLSHTANFIMHSHTPTYPPTHPSTIHTNTHPLYMYTGLAGATCSNHAISAWKQHWWTIRGRQTLKTTQAQVFNTARQPDWNHPRVSLPCPLSGDPATDVWLWGNHQGWQGHDRDMEDHDCTQAKNKETQVRLWRGVRTAPQTFATHLLPYYFQLWRRSGNKSCLCLSH